MLYIPDESSPEIHWHMHSLVTDVLRQLNVPNPENVSAHVITRLLSELLAGTQPYINQIPPDCLHSEMFGKYKVHNKRQLCREYGITESYFDRLYAQHRKQNQRRLL